MRAMNQRVLTIVRRREEGALARLAASILVVAILVTEGWRAGSVASRVALGLCAVLFPVIVFQLDALMSAVVTLEGAVQVRGLFRTTSLPTQSLALVRIESDAAVFMSRQSREVLRLPAPDWPVEELAEALGRAGVTLTRR